MTLTEYLNEIEKVSNENIEEKYKRLIIHRLWEKYNEAKEESSIGPNNEKYINDNTLRIKRISNEEVAKASSNIKSGSYNEDDALMLLNWVISNLYDELKKIGIDMNKNTLDGLCELTQFMTIYPLEQLGLKVTKNHASAAFDYLGNHAFGTVSFNIDGQEVKYLIDPTYKQFFIKDRCTKGRLYIDEQISPGYYAEQDFASMLLRTGYFRLTEETAKLYGEPFSKSSESNEKIDYYENIVSSTEDYSFSKDNIDNLNYKIPRTIQ